MLFFRRCAMLSVMMATMLGISAAQAANVTIEFEVTVPNDTPADAQIFLAGSSPQLGGLWKADGARLQRKDDHTFAQTIEFPQGGKLEYKVTRGTWESVEKTADGQEMANRTVQLDRSQRVAIRIAKWAGGAGAANVAMKKETITGNVRALDDFESRILENRRQIFVYLPPEYDKDSHQRFAVLYMHDGQNCFNDASSFAGEWKADETAERLIKEGKIEPIIIVAIANAGTARVDEYTPSVDTKRNEGGRGDLYARFLMTELKPFIDKTYQTIPDRAHTAVCGSSLGGLISLHIARTYPDQVGLCAAVSPSLWWDEKQMLAAIEKDPKWTADCKIWFDMGTAEGLEDPSQQNLENTRKLADILQCAGRRADEDFKCTEVAEGQHNEAAWSSRFGDILLFLFGK